MKLCLDSGNSRIKWAFLAKGEWQDAGVTAHGDLSKLAALTASYPAPEQILLANVAGPVVEGAICAALAPWGVALEIVAPSGAACGVINGYENPTRLGVDRWCALIGARALSPSATLVVMAGTATTVDSLDADGHFLGGLILPGQHLMLNSLARDTAALPFAQGVYQAFPASTEDAIVTGAIEAQVGAIERAWGRLPGQPKACLISGGHAALLVEQLGVPCRQVDNLPLEGMRVILTSGRH